MRKLTFLVLGLTFFTLGCKKEEKIKDLHGNNVDFEETYFEIEENIFLEIPNDQFSWVPNLANCLPIPGTTIDYEAFIATENPNLFAHLAEDMHIKNLVMELTNIPDCSFEMLESVEIYLCDLGLTSESQFVFYNPNNPNASFNAVKIGQALNIGPSPGSILTLDANKSAVIDQFIHDGNFQTFAKMVFDKAFTEDSAIIKTTMTMAVRLKNEE